MVCRGRAEFEAPGNSEQLTDDLESVAELVREFPIKVSVLWTEKRRQRDLVINWRRTGKNSMKDEMELF